MQTKEYRQNYYKENRERLIAKALERYYKNRDAINERNKKRNNENYAALRERAKQKAKNEQAERLVAALQGKNWRLFQGRYVTDKGEVFNKFGRLSSRKPMDTNGFLYCDTDEKKSLKVHRVVWMAFNGDIPERKDVRHINGDRSDNRLSNLMVI